MNRGEVTAAPVPASGGAAAAKAQATLVLSSTREVADYLVTYGEGHDPRSVRGNDLTEAKWVEAHRGDGELAAFRRAQTFGLPLLDLRAVSPDPQVVGLVPPAIAHRFQLVPVLSQSGVLGVAVADPAVAEIVPTLSFLTDRRIALLVAEPRQIGIAIAENYDRVEDASIAVQLGLDIQQPVGELGEQQAQQLAQQQPIVRLIADMFADAARRRASDIHLRPGADGVDLLYRIDDELVSVRRFLRLLQPALITRLKVLGGMNLAEHRVPQDGRSSYDMGDGRALDLRISVLPTIHGESAVVRLLDKTQALRGVGQLGFSAVDQAHFVDLLTRSHGMILATGPTGSGKSTTLYAALQETCKQPVNVVTIEDPVEFHIEKAQQMQVNRAAGFTFARALRNILRHDPDVIMVGEIRDRETAQIAVESALTGHLLLSTLHTNTAATAVTRMLDLGVESFLLRSTLLAVVSQRLTRRNCPHCLAPEVVLPRWREALGVDPDEVFQRGTGCNHCEGLGVYGRVGVYEILRVTPAIRRLIQPHCEADVIHETALREGMVSLTAHALALARQGVISLGEAFRLRID